MIWVTGCSGMLGRHISEKVSVAGIPYISTDREIDITDISAVHDFTKDHKIEWIINCAAYTAVDRAEDEKDKAFSVNADGAKNIAVLSEAAGARLIHFSTDYVFPGTKECGYKEDDETGPESIYGKSKLSGESVIKAVHDVHFIFRISWLYGPYGKNFVHTMLNLFEERDVLNVVNDQFGSPTCTGELADFIIRFVDNDSDKYGIYHFSGEGMTNWFEFASEIYSLALKYGITERKVVINPVDSSKYPQKAKRPAYSYMLKDKLYNIFGYRPKDWRETLEDYIRLMKH